ncbi:hypothetical protein ABZX40_01130 [Streptomyces sp. NPDC004610]|uniref:hypothetical protein n=1 Tax=unclassified Streptomyces TaxID=2593676 RepID=UPI0033BEC87F
MSTEARRPPLPPRPTAPPPPAHPPAPAAPPDSAPEDSNTPDPHGTADRPAAPPGARPLSIWERPAPQDTTGTDAAGETDEPDKADKTHESAVTGEPGGPGGPGETGPEAPAAPPVTPPSPPPPPVASARFPDAAPTAGHPPRRAHFPAEAPGEHTRRPRPFRPADDHPGRPGITPTVPPPRPAPHPGPDPARSWSALPATGRPLVSFGRPEGYDADARPRPLGRRLRGRTVAVASCVVLGIGLIGGAVTGSWLAGDSGADRERDAFVTAGDMWHSVPVDRLFPPAVDGKGAGPGGADRTWTRVAVAPDGGCSDAFDPLLQGALAPVGCERLLRATYTDATQSFVTTVGLLFTDADATAMRALAQRFEDENLAARGDLMPRPYAAENTVAAGFGDDQRASWTVHVLTDAPVVVYSVSGWADDRRVDRPQPAADAVEADAGTDPAQAGLGHEAKGLADRIERTLRKNVTSPSEQPS